MFGAKVTSSRVLNEIRYGIYREVATTSECLGQFAHFPPRSYPSFALNCRCGVCDIVYIDGNTEKNSVFMMQSTVL